MLNNARQLDKTVPALFSRASIQTRRSRIQRLGWILPRIQRCSEFGNGRCDINGGFRTVLRAAGQQIGIHPQGATSGQVQQFAIGQEHLDAACGIGHQYLAFADFLPRLNGQQTTFCITHMRCAIHQNDRFANLSHESLP